MFRWPWHKRRGIPRMRERKLYVPDFTPHAREEQILNRYIELFLMDTSMSLDREGHTQEQIEAYTCERPEFVRKYGQDLLTYLQPYEAVPTGAYLAADEGRRVMALRRLKGELKKAESE